MDISVKRNDLPYFCVAGISLTATWLTEVNYLWHLRLMRVLGAGIYLEFRNQAVAQLVLWQHAFDRVADHAIRIADQVKEYMATASKRLEKLNEAKREQRFRGSPGDGDCGGSLSPQRL